ncbi:MAG: ABC transporter permease [Actinobacteria bacterium]|nr:ABC transporter permease [Actinomycetota bacterium]MSV64383.1 ABC transporter permease [Actinomycetota bacterium]MSW26261.1 ABC transporter permease [Actinomycetota bacterium]MSW34578.1 ABC transporter permease [Actinomycetota bacterium]MSX31604.1 ABC transporter permease [Actinomycetota bacterium]
MTELSLTIIFIVGFLALVSTSQGVLLSRASLQGFLTYLAVPIVIGMAQMVVLCIGQMNLAVGAMGGVSTAIMATQMADHKVSIPVALLVGFLGATAMGAINGALVVLTQLNGFIITLGTMTILLGVQYRLVRTFTIDKYPTSLPDFGKKNIVGFPLILVIAIATSVVLSMYFSRTGSGRRVLATGGNALAARLSGVSNSRSVFIAHTLSGALVGVAAIITIASLPGINRSIGGDWMLSSFSAPIIGGVLMAGGTVAVYGTVIAAGVIRLVDIARAQYSLDPSIVSLTVGVVVLSTVALSEWRRRRTVRQNEGRKVLPA